MVPRPSLFTAKSGIRGTPLRALYQGTSLLVPQSPPQDFEDSRTRRKPRLNQQSPALPRRSEGLNSGYLRSIIRRVLHHTNDPTIVVPSTHASPFQTGMGAPRKSRGFRAIS